MTIRLRTMLLIPLGLLIACEPGTCGAPPPPALGDTCKDASDWGICEDGGAAALVCVEKRWTRVSCAAVACAQVEGQPSFAGRYWLKCGAAPADETAPCERIGEVTTKRDDPSRTLTCKGHVWTPEPSSSASAKSANP